MAKAMSAYDVEITTGKKLYEHGEIDNFEYSLPQFFRGKTVIKFGSLRAAVGFATGFIHQHIIPKYGFEGALKFPMAKSEPWRDDAADVLTEMLGAKKPNPNQETWLVMPSDRYHEIQEHVCKNTLPFVLSKLNVVYG